MTRAEKLWTALAIILFALCLAPALAHCETLVFDPSGYAPTAGGDYFPEGATLATAWPQVQDVFGKCQGRDAFVLLIPDYVAAEIPSGLIFTRSSAAPVTIRGVGTGTPSLRCGGSFLGVNNFGTTRRTDNVTVENLALSTYKVAVDGKTPQAHCINLGFGSNRAYIGNTFVDCEGVAIRDDNPREIRRNVTIRDNVFLRTAYNIFTGIQEGVITGNTCVISTFEHNIRLWAANNVRITDNRFLLPEGRGHALTLRAQSYCGVPTRDVWIQNNLFAGGKWLVHVGPADYLDARKNDDLGFDAFGPGIVFVQNLFAPTDAATIPLVCHESAQITCTSNNALDGARVTPWIFGYAEDGRNYKVEAWRE